MRNEDDLISIPSESNIFIENQEKDTKQTQDSQNPEKHAGHSNHLSDEFKNRSFLYFIPIDNVAKVR